MKKIIFGVFVLSIICSNGLFSQKIAGMRASSPEISGGSDVSFIKNGKFISIKGADGTEYRVYAAGPENAMMGIMVVHDFFGITPSTIESVERLGALGYRTIAVDLYNGKSATTNDSAQALMQAKDRKETDRILKAGIDYLKRPGRKLATIGYSAGGVDAMNANLMDPDSFNGTVIVYGGGYDKIEKAKIEKLRSPVLAVTGAKDEWPVQAALNFFANEKDKSFEIYIYPGAYHAYSQPLFLNGKNYDAEATRVTWKIMEDFLSRHLNN
jgi:carboxymethylenebutenolidase